MNDTATVRLVTVEGTTLKTLWSESIIEILLDSLRHDKSDAQVIYAVRDLYRKKFKAEYLLNKVSKELGNSFAKRLAGLIKTRPNTKH